ncbi:hypothetical protein ACJ41O_002492 [Fusarium nematophilum]
MPPPSHLAIATSSVNRLLKEEASYHKELEQQEAEVKALQEKIDKGEGDDDGNGNFILKQQVGLFELGISLISHNGGTVFEPLRKRIASAVEKLEEQIAVREQVGAPEAELQQAKETLAKAKGTENGA